MQSLANRGGIAPDHDEVSAGGGVWVFAALFSIAQRDERYLKAFREFLLREAKGAANNLDLRRSLHARQSRRRARRRQVQANVKHSSVG